MIIVLYLAFATRQLRTLCESEAMTERAFGIKTAMKLRQRLADLRAAPNASDLIVGQPRDVDANPHPQKVVEIGPGARLVFRANHNTVPRTASGAVDWSHVSRIQILKIEVDDE